MVAASVKPYRLQRKATLFKGGFLLDLELTLSVINNNEVNTIIKGGVIMIKQTAGRESLGDFAPNFAHYNDDILFGENWNDDSIDLKTRCIITVVALMSSGITDNSLKYHLENAKKNGVTKEEIAGIITHTAFYVGWPKGWAVFNLAKEVYKDE